MPYLGNSISKFTTADDLTVSGDADIDGTANLDVVDIDGAVDMASTLAVSGASTFSSDIDVQGSAGATLKLTSTDTSGADTELLGQIDFVSSDSSTGSAGTQARIKGVYEDNGDSSGIAFLAGASTGSGTPTISEVMRIRHEGRVGIGEDNPATTVHITASAPALSLNTAASMTSGNRADINVYNSDRSGVGLIRFGAETDNVGTNIQFYTRPASGSLAERMRILAGGNIDISAGHILLDNGYGINFAATSDAGGMTSEILDDYEEGTWTASVVGSSGGTAQTMSGYYTKVGNKVYVHASAVSGLNLSSSSGVLVINGLPFTAKSTSYQLFHLAHNNAGTYPSGRTQAVGYVTGNTQIVGLCTGSGSAWGDFSIGSATSAGIIVSGTYEVA